MSCTGCTPDGNFVGTLRRRTVSTCLVGDLLLLLLLLLAFSEFDLRLSSTDVSGGARSMVVTSAIDVDIDVRCDVISTSLGGGLMVNDGTSMSSDHKPIVKQQQQMQVYQTLYV